MLKLGFFIVPGSRAKWLTPATQSHWLPGLLHTIGLRPGFVDLQARQTEADDCSEDEREFCPLPCYSLVFLHFPAWLAS